MPLTLHQPKAMIGIVDRPMIHYVIDEIAAAGIRRIIIVAGPQQHEFKRYVEHLEKSWDKKYKIQFQFAVQKNQWGNGDAIYAARHLLKNEPFLVCFSDDLLVDAVPPMQTLVKLFHKTQSPIVTLERVPKSRVSSYGVVKATKHGVSEHAYRISDVVEKPKISEAPSNLTIIGRYVLTPEILAHIGNLYPYRGREIGLADALKNYARAGNELCGWLFQGTRFDAGSKLGILKAQAYFGTHHKEFGAEFVRYLKNLRS